LIDYFYKGSNDSTLSSIVEDVNRIKLLKNSTKGNVWRSVQTAYDLLSQLDKNKHKIDNSNEDDFKAAVQNMYASKEFAEVLEESRDNQNKADILLMSRNDGSEQAQMSEKDIQFRNWLINSAKNNPDIREILDCFGQFMAYANKLKREKYFPSVTNISDVTIGSDLSMMLPSEYINLVIPELEDYFNYKYATDSLLQYKSEDKQETGKGGVHLVLDISGSMYDPLNPYAAVTKKINIAIGFTMAMIKILEEQDRRCVLHVFNTSCSNVFDSDHHSASDCIRKTIGISPTGGTHIQNAIKTVFAPKYEELDVIVITDGEDNTLHERDVVKGNKRLSCLLISHRAPDYSALRNVSDSFITANNKDGFDHLVEDLLK
jgi:uncharacterized protein with von Willebrand factor type A (vWA) domain